jgi:hypothetical protein
MDFTLNGSDTDWLVYADYLEDQGIDSAHIREGVVDPQTNQFCKEYKFTNHTTIPSLRLISIYLNKVGMLSQGIHGIGAATTHEGWDNVTEGVVGWPGGVGDEGVYVTFAIR